MPLSWNEIRHRAIAFFEGMGGRPERASRLSDGADHKTGSLAITKYAETYLRDGQILGEGAAAGQEA